MYTQSCRWAAVFFDDHALAMMAWILAWSAREDGWITAFQKRLRESYADRSSDAIWRSFCSLVDVKLTSARVHIPKRCHICPKWIAEEWSQEELLNGVVPVMLQLLESPTAEVLAEAAKFLKRKRAPPKSSSSTKDVGLLRSPYPAEHVIRTLLLVSNTNEPGEKFVVMGEGFSRHQINILKALGFQGISDVNKHLPPDAHVTPRILAFYVCQCKVLESSK